MSSLKDELQSTLLDGLEIYSEEVKESIIQYLAQLNEKEQIAFHIAKDHLGTSFHIVKSIGYITWKKKQI